MMKDDPQSLFAPLRAAILDLDADRAETLAREILRSGGNALHAIEEVIRPTADEIGRKFDAGEYFLPQLMLAGRALEAAVIALSEALKTGETTGRQVIVIGTVKGDLHSIGKNVVANMLRASGFIIHDLGIDVDSNRFIEEAEARGAEIIALSSLLTTTLPYQREVIGELKARGLRSKYKVVIGGGPASEAWASEIEADGYGKDAVAAVAEVRRLTAKKGIE
jgi:methanogenic corrinoid protein MtbC1